MYFDVWSASVSASCLLSVLMNSARSFSLFFFFFSSALYSSTTDFGASGYSWYGLFRNTPASE